MIWPFGRKEERAVDPQVFFNSSSDFPAVFLGGGGMSASGETVTIDSALGVPAIWSAVNFIAGTVAGLPLMIYRRTDAGRKRVSDTLASVLHDRANDALSSFDWRKWKLEQVLTGGRGLTFIERNGAGRVIGLWPMDPADTTIKRIDGQKVYDYTENGKARRYQASEVIDLAFMLKADLVGHRSPIMQNKEVVGMAQAMAKYGGSYFSGGGVPPFAVTGPFQSEGAMKRARSDFEEAVKNAAKEKRQALVLPSGLEIKPIGADPQKSQMVEAQRFMIEQIARIYSLPPVFLQDLSHGTFSNTEQQDLHFVKHTIKRWVEQFEQELNLKLFPRGSKLYAEFELDGLLRGDFKTRMDGYAQAIQNGILMPNEARDMENRTRAEGGDRLFMQGAMVPITETTAPDGDDGEGDGDAA